MPGYGLTPCVSDEQPFLHRPAIFSIHESAHAFVAIVSADGMSGVHGFALGEDGVEAREHRQMLSAEEESQIRLFCGMGAVVVGDFGCPHDVAEDAAVESR